MGEGRDIACGMHQFLCGKPVRLAAKPVSSVMGRLADFELAIFLKTASTGSPHGASRRSRGLVRSSRGQV
jgi:hypothetical protein